MAGERRLATASCLRQKSHQESEAAFRGSGAQIDPGPRSGRRLKQKKLSLHTGVDQQTKNKIFICSKIAP
jgi:hypothetical protein